MKTLSGFHVCLAFSSILLSSLGVRCVAIEKRDTNDSVHIPQNVQSLLSPTSQGANPEDGQSVLTVPPGTSMANTITSDGTTQAFTKSLDHDILIGDQSTDTRSITLPLTSVVEEAFLPSTKQNKSQESGLLTTTVTTSSPLQSDIEVNLPSVTVSKTTLGTPTTIVPAVSKFLDEDFPTKGTDEKSNGNGNTVEHPPLSQFNTEEMLTTNPRTSIVQTGSDYSTAPLLFAEHSETGEHGVIVSSLVNTVQLTTVTDIRTDVSTGVEDLQKVQPFPVSPALEFSEDWDDTKPSPSSQVKVIEHETIMLVPAMSPETVSTDTVTGKLDLTFTNRTETSTENMEKIYSRTEESTMLAIGDGETPIEAAEDDFGPTVSSTDTLDESILSTPFPSSISHTSFMTDSVDVPSVVSESVNLFDGTIKQTEETASITTVTSSPTSSERTPLVSSTKRLRVYGLKKLESEEGEEDEEEEEKDEDEEEDDDDEEEDDEDKDAESLDDSVEGEIEVLAFTLPVVASIKTPAEKTNQQALEEVSYRVPDTLEWEKQNLGLGALIILLRTSVTPTRSNATLFSTSVSREECTQIMASVPIYSRIAESCLFTAHAHGIKENVPACSYHFRAASFDKPISERYHIIPVLIFWILSFKLP
ncbi:armadillo-like helical domain-containing protein 4 isoform X1 [Pleurodeles waltl]|uniref:armadillo-like helical domain-containing protein 4 isoform X1 n=1 Tax=Pleurodeles waltl TaxID=8319 RepID=UPI0037097BC9